MSDAPPNANAVAAPTSSDNRASPRAVTVSMRSESDAINASTNRQAEMPRATVTPVSPHSERHTIEIGMSTTNAETAIGRSNWVRCMTNISGYVIENAALATIQGDR